MIIRNFSTDHIIDSLPENKILYKDSGLWQIRSDDMESVIFQQRSSDTFRGFIISYAEEVMDGKHGETEKEVLDTNLCVYKLVNQFS